jgi:hypothetical protein
MRGLLAALLLLAVVAPVTAKEKSSAERALEVLKKADRLAYRPVDEGLKDIRFEFDVDTQAGKLRAQWLFRAAAKDKPRRKKNHVLKVSTKAKRRLYAAALHKEFAIITAPIRRKPFANLADDRIARWDATKRKVVLTAKKGAKTKVVRIEITMNSDHLPSQVSWFTKEIDEEDPMEKEIEVETSSTYDWKRIGSKWFVTMMNSNRTGTRLIAKYEYAKVKGITLPKKVTQIDPLGGEDPFPLLNIRVNEGIADAEFKR